MNAAKKSLCEYRPGTEPVPLMEGLRNLEKGYDRKFALAFCKDDVWAALELLERMLEPGWWREDVDSNGEFVTTRARGYYECYDEIAKALRVR